MRCAGDGPARGASGWRSLACSAALAGICLLAPATADAAFFRNTTPFDVPGAGTSGQGALYPLIQEVSGVPGTVLEVAVSIDVRHERPSDVDAMVVAPSGQKAILMSDACGSTALTQAHFFLFDDAAPGPLPSGSCYLKSGSYRPTDYSGEEVVPMPPPAPPAPYPVATSALNGAVANGTWRLFVNDDAVSFTGGIEEFTLRILSSGATCAGRTATTAEDQANAGGTVIEGTPGPDVLVGSTGNDSLRGHGGNDLICGGGGRDEILGDAGSDRLFGGAARDLMLGGRGRDRLKGQGGKDLLAGGAQRDVCIGGKGRDRFACEKVKQ